MAPEQTADQDQEPVIDHDAGRLVVTGASGTGKTTALEERLVRLITSGADPSRVALITRSKAERFALRERLLPRVGAVSDLNVLTMQALAFQVAGRLGVDNGAEEPIEVLDATEQFALVRELLMGEDPAGWPAYGAMLESSRGFAEQVRTFLLRAQEASVEPERLIERAAAADLTGFIELARFYERYLNVLASQGQTDYPGLVLHAAAAARSASAPLFDHIMIDDHQDTTLADQLLIDALAPGSLVIAGRLDGHVFSFQGTTDEPFRVALSEGPSIELTTQHRGVAHEDAWITGHPSEEYAAIARELRRIHVDDDIAWHDMAVVVRRADRQLTGILRALDDAAIPRIAPDNFNSLLVQAATAPYIVALRWLARPDQRDVLIEPLLSSDLTRLTPAEARTLVREARLASRPPAHALTLAADHLPHAAPTVQQLADALDAAEQHIDSAADAFRALWMGSPHSSRLVESEAAGDLEARSDLDAILALTRVLNTFSTSSDPSVEAYLSWLEAGDEGPGLAEQDGPRDAVRVLTAHGTAGHEFDTVIVAGASEGNFPSVGRPEPMFDLRALDGPLPEAERTRERLLDEQRLFDLVRGRARRRVLLCAANDDRADASNATRSRFVQAEWVTAPTPPFPEPVSVAEAASTWRRRLADPDVAPVDRLTALEGLVALGVDPAQWWYQLDWTDPKTRLREKPRVSASRLNTLEDCELRFVLNEELGLDSRSSPAMWVGKAVHKILEDADNGEIPKTLDALQAAMEERWHPEYFATRAASNAYLRMVQENVWPRWLVEYADRELIAPEQRFKFEFHGADVTGAIDRIGGVEGGSEITDYKTGRRPWGDDAKADNNLQLAIYYLAIHEVPELQQYLPVKHIELTFVREENRREGGTFRVERGFTPSSAATYEQATRERLADLIDRVNTIYDDGVIEPNPKANCRFCSFKPLCPLYPESHDLFPKDAA